MLVRLLLRAVLGTAVTLVVLAALVLAGVRWLGPDRLAATLSQTARDRGIPLSGFTIETVSPSAVVLTDISLGDRAVVIDRATVRVDLDRVARDGRVEDVALDGVRVRAALVDGGIRLPGIDLRAGGGPAGAPAGLPRLPVDRVTVSGLDLAVTTPVGPVTVAASAVIDGPPGGPLALRTTDLAVSVPNATLSGRLVGTVEPDLSASVRFSDLAGRVDRDRARLTFADAEAAVDRPVGRPVTWSVTVPRISVTVPGRPALDGRLTADGDPFPRRISVAADGAESGVSAFAEVALDPPAADTAQAIAQIGLQADDLAAAAAAAGIGLPLAGSGRLDGTLTVPLAALRTGTGTSWSERLAGSRAQAVLTGHGVAWGEALTDGEIDLPLALALRRDGLAVRSSGPWTARGRWAGLPVGLTLAGPGDRPVTVGVPLSGPAAVLDVDAGGRGYWGDRIGAGAVAATLGWSDEGLRLDDGRFSLATGPIAVGDMTVRIVEATMRGHGDGDRFTGRAALSAVLAGEAAAVGVDGAAVSADLGIDWQAGRLVVDPVGDCQTVTADRLTVGNGVRVTRPIQFCLGRSGDRPLAVWDRSSGAVRLASRLGPVETSIRMAGTGLEVSLPPVALVASRADRPSPWRFEGRLQGGTVAAADPGLSLTGLDLAVTGTGPSAGSPLSAVASVREGRLASTAVPALFAPMRVIGRAGLTGDRLDGRVTATGALGALTVRADVSHRIASGQGAVDIALEPLSFAPGVRQPGDVAPVAATRSVEDVSGVVAATGRVAWRPGRPLDSSGTVTVSDGAVVTGAGTVLGVETVLTLSSLVPPVLPPGQTLRFEQADIGVLVGPGRAVFGLDADRVLSVSDIAIDWADGVLAAEPFTLDVTAVAPDLVLTAEGISLPAVLAPLPIEGLSTTGRLRGRVPVRVEGTALVIDNAVLESAEPGLIRYRPAEPPAFAAGDAGGGVDLFLRAVENLNYESLRLTLDGRTGQDLEVGIAIEGANPDLYDGYPVALNVTVTGALDEILRDSLRAANYGLLAGDRLQERAREAVTGDAIDEILRIGQ